MYEECSVAGCAKPKKARTLCAAHWARNRRYGSPTARGVRARSREERMEMFTRRLSGSGCLAWTGTKLGRKRKDGNRYGAWSGQEGSRYAHRNVWEFENGPVPDGHVVDHLCHNRWCVEISHLRLATAGENAANRGGPTRQSTTGFRNVYLHPRGYVVSVQKGGMRRTRTFGPDGLEEAVAYAAILREEVHGPYAGKG